MEKFIEKNNFIRRLHLDSETQKAVLDYHMKIKGDPFMLTRGDHSNPRGLLDTYSRLLLIARTPYRTKKEAEEVGLVDIHYEWVVESDLRRYSVGYKPKEISTDGWFLLCDAFADCGFLRPFIKDDSQSLRWPEIDHVFKFLADYYICSESFYDDAFVIGCFNPRIHADYEALDRALGASDLERLLNYISAVSPEFYGDLFQIFYGEYHTGDFERWVMEYAERQNVLGRAEVIANVNRIYLGQKIVVEF